jgi:hypothetical protein
MDNYISIFPPTFLKNKMKKVTTNEQSIKEEKLVKSKNRHYLLFVNNLFFTF